LQKEKALYSSLNKLKKEDKLFLGFVWIPKADVGRVQKDVEDIKKKDENIELPTFKLVNEHGIRPPSLFRMNEVTWIFQEIVNTYGIPTYKEVNPSVFGIVTFPFLFGIMFGDIGHGSLLFLIGIILTLFAEPIRRASPGAEGLLSIRYLILLMGFFALFCGLMYNDFLAIPIWLFDSCYELRDLPVDPANEGHHGHPPQEAVPKADCVYPFGIDPVWYMGKNELAFLNSLKMKLSVILGVLQMSLGIVMKAFNATYRSSKLDFFLEFVPQIILMTVLFGYMDLLIICKWCTDFTHVEYEAPAVITTMINMALNGGAIEPGTRAVVGSAGFQQGLSVACLLIALVCVPWMLFPKPIYLDKMNKMHAQHVHDANNIPLQE
jgi:V-type H+-transporting ATPase subunit a